STKAQTNSAAYREVAAPEMNSAAATERTTAAPPRYGVVRACPLYPPGTSTKSVRTATRIATGTNTSAATRESANAAARSSSPGNYTASGASRYSRWYAMTSSMASSIVCRGAQPVVV